MCRHHDRHGVPGFCKDGLHGIPLDNVCAHPKMALLQALHDAI
jgi:hypothetical protein